MYRELLNKGDRINGRFQYVIESVSGQGASCIVYKAWYKEDNNSEPHWVQLKELYPYDIGLFRDVSNNLICKTEEDKKKFDEYKKNFEASNNMLVKLNRLTDSTPCEIQSFPYNGTKYSIVAYNNGKQHSEKELQKIELNKLLEIIESLAISVNRLHEEGYLHLDIKPDNFLINDIGSAILFDVDSVVPVDEIKYRKGISYSKKWAAPEVKQAAKKGDYKDISCKSDIFSIGVILFEAIMDRDFLPMETVAYNRNWDIENRVKVREEKQNRKVNINPKFYHQIKVIFEKTLDRNPDNRYKTADELHNALDKARDMLKENPWIIPSFRTVPEQFTGRKNELAEMNSIMQKEDTVFLHGFGGIGKSELALKYAEKHKEDFDTVVFCKYQDDIKDALSEIRIAHFENDDNTKYLKKLAELCDERTLIILDNFDAETDADDYLDEFINNYHCKKIITTRTDFSGLYKQKQLDVEALNQDDAVLLFEKESKWHPETEGEKETLNEILKLIGYHTYFTVILAKKRKKFSLSIDALKKQTEEKLFKTSGKVTVAKDGKLTTSTIDALAAKLFDFDSISESQKQTLYNLYMLSWRTVSRNDYTKIAGYGMSDEEKVELINALDDLTRLGWILHDDKSDDFYIHQIMKEMVKENCKDEDDSVNNMVEYFLDSCRLINKDDDKIRRLERKKGPLHRFLDNTYEKDKVANKERGESIIHFSNSLFSVSKKFLSIILEMIAQIIGFVSTETDGFNKLFKNISEYCCSFECPLELQKQWMAFICNNLHYSFRILDGKCVRFYSGEYIRLCVSFYEKSEICKESFWDAKRGYWIFVRDYIEREKEDLLNNGASLKQLKLNEYEMKLITYIEEIKDVLGREELAIFEAFKNEKVYKEAKEHLGASFSEPFGAVNYKRYLSSIDNSKYGQKEIIKGINSDEKVKDVKKIFATAKQNGFDLAYQELLANIKLTYEEKRKILFVLFAESFEIIINHLKKQGDDKLENYANFLILYAEERLKLGFIPSYSGNATTAFPSSYLGTLFVGLYLKNKDNFNEVLSGVFEDYISRYFKKEDLLNVYFWKSMCDEFAEFNLLNIIFDFVYENVNKILDENDKNAIDEISFLKLFETLSHQVYDETKDKYYLEMGKGYKEKINKLREVYREKNCDSLKSLFVVKENFDYKIKE